MKHDDNSEFLSNEDMGKMHIVLESFVHSGTALTIDADGDPGVAHTLILGIEHRRNQSDHTLEPSQTLFGLQEGTAMDLCGRLLVAIDLTYGTEALRDLLVKAAEVAGAMAAKNDHEKGENDD